MKKFNQPGKIIIIKKKKLIFSWIFNFFSWFYEKVQSVPGKKKKNSYLAEFSIFFHGSLKKFNQLG